MAMARIATGEQRAAAFAGLATRNRIVGALRVAVPAAGVLAFAALVIQIHIANLASQYGISRIRLDRGSLVVETPQYSAVGQDGAHYLVTARSAQVALDRQDEIVLADAQLQLAAANGATYSLAGSAATMNTRTQIVDAPGIVAVDGTDVQGTVTDLTADLENEMATAHGAVDLTLRGGTIIRAASMVRDGRRGTWTFGRATVIMSDLPEAEE